MEEKKVINSTNFLDNMKLPIHRWFRYSAGYSAEWVEKTVLDIIKSKKLNKHNIKLLDPFLGSGTTVLACEKIGIKAIGFESHPLISRVANAKLQWDVNIKDFIDTYKYVLNESTKLKKNSSGYPELIYKCYSIDNIEKLDSLKQIINNLNLELKEAQLAWLAFVSILRKSSHAGTAQWQYILPNKTKVNVSDPYEAYKLQCEIMVNDIKSVQMEISKNESKNKGIFFKHDSRILNKKVNKQSVDLVITSPPYANNYDYADATRLELSFLGEVTGWSDLRKYVSPNIIRACTQHVSDLTKETFNIINNKSLEAIHDELFNICTTLAEERKNHGGKKNYHTMIATYFLDISKVLKNLRYYCKDGADVCFVIGDSAPYGIYVPVDELIGKLAISAGFKSYEFIKIKDRNTKWKNRKHTVLLKEGFLWIKG